MTKTYSVILVCTCFRMDKKALETFAVMFPDKVPPIVIKGNDRISKLATSIKNEHLRAISKLSGKFAYYVELENGIIKKEYDLLRGKRIS